MPLRILTVCTHNRTRSVMMAALLDSLLTERLGPGIAEIASAGFGTEGLPAISDAVSAMRRRGIDVSEHRSRSTTASLVDAADLIVVAERHHVVKVAALSSWAFPRTMTLPELLDRAAAAAIEQPQPAAPSTLSGAVRSWAATLTSSRTASSFLREPVPELADPTGSSARSFEAAVVAIERQCTELADAVAQVTQRS
jgi:protein-tyrosine-phosphatase